MLQCLIVLSSLVCHDLARPISPTQVRGVDLPNWVKNSHDGRRCHQWSLQFLLLSLLTMPWSSSPPSTPDSTTSQDPPNSPFSPLFASFARLYGASRPHISPIQNTESETPSVPVQPRRKLDKSMISSPTSMSFSHLTHVAYDEEKGLASSGFESPFLAQESKERDLISEEIRRRRRLSSDSIRSRMSSPTSPSLCSQLADGSLYENEKGFTRLQGIDSDARVASLTELDRMDRSSVPMPTSSPYRAFTRRESSADEAQSYFDPFAGPEHPSHPHSVETRMDRPKSVDKGAISSPQPDSFLHVAHMGHNTAKGIASTCSSPTSLAEVFVRPQSGTTSSGESKTGSNSPLAVDSLPDVSTTETPHVHLVSTERQGSSSPPANPPLPPAPSSPNGRISPPSPPPPPPPHASSPPPPSTPTSTRSTLPPANRPCPLRPMPDPFPPAARIRVIRLRPIPRPGVPVRRALRPLPRRASLSAKGREGF
ncbi:hypothetical protein R3P38DRAFT_973636 [Favolaschia claudopus]|uniref:CRIB domain-containing protein n=1 Tax=Favolaschia claudopus TaxID=2862362 RepID=A0AAW0E7Z7_9AGAR